MLVSLLIIIAGEAIFLLILYFYKKAFTKEEHLLWLNDYEIIEQLHGEKRDEYIKLSFKITSSLLYSYMIFFPIWILVRNNSLIFYSLLVCFIFLNIYFIYRSYQLQKKYKNLLQ